MTAPRAGRAQLEQAVAAAKAAFPDWSAPPPRQRGALLAGLADALDAEKGAFARLLTQEQGKPLPQALGEIEFAVATLALPPGVLGEDATRKGVQLRKPLGVVAAILP